MITSRTIGLIWIFFLFGCSSFGNSAPIATEKYLAPEGQAVAMTAVDETTEIDVTKSSPCVGAPAPAQWNHVVVLVFENHYSNHDIIGSSRMPYITSLANGCGMSDNWNDADFRVDGTPDGEYNSKPSYATLTNGLSPSVHGLLDDEYDSKTDVESIYDQLAQAGKPFKNYYDAEAGGCSVRFTGDYHDSVRYYKSMSSICDEHDVPISTFSDDLKSGDLPAFSMIIPSNDHNQHDNSLESGDAWAKDFLEPILDSVAYRKGDVAIFFLWDEESPVPNVLIAPSIIPGSKVLIPSGNPISHFSALRTWEEMLGLPLLGDTNLAPSLLTFFDGS